MGPQWPPSPRVEDEESALKNEIAHKPERNHKTEAEEGRYRGTVDQYPIILDINRQADSKRDYTSSTDNEGESVKTQSSDDSYGPATPPTSKHGRRHGQSTADRPSSRSRSGKEIPSVNIVKDPQEEDARRGRKNMPRIQTDLGNDLQGMMTGQRRAPSPYSYTKPDALSTNDGCKRLSGNTLLPPESFISTQTLPTTDIYKRHSSAQPPSIPRISRNDSDDSAENERRRRHHSTGRSKRETSSNVQSRPDDGLKEPSAGNTKSSYYAYSRAVKDLDIEAAHKNVASDDQTKRNFKESPSTSCAQDSWSRSHSDFISRSDKPLSRKSSMTSSAEEGKSLARESTRSKESKGMRSHRASVSRKERPRLDLSGHQYAYHGGSIEERQSSAKHGKHSNPVFDGRSYLEPSSVRSPKAMEEYLEKAFKDKKIRASRESPHPSPNASPRGSPPGTPPRTPRWDRRSRDYFSSGTSATIRPSEATHSRVPSHGDGDHNQVKPLAGIVTAAAAAKHIPSLSRSSTSSLEMPSSTNPGKVSSGRRSRNTSPTRDERAPLHRPRHEHEESARKIMRDEERPDSKPVSRSGSTSYHLPSTGSFDRLGMRSGSYAASPAEPPKLNHRAFSYSTTDQSSHTRQPSSANAAQFHLAPSLTPTTIPMPNSAPLPAIPRLPRSPSSFEQASRAYHSSELPPCPRSTPEAGHYDWYTVASMPELDICPSCMAILGSSRFHDLFVPSTSKVAGQKILCDFSRTWVRNAWAQTMKQRRNTLDMIYEVIRNSQTTKPCPRKASDVRAWYRLPDPETGSNVPNFDACSECVRSIEIILPQLRGVFKRSGALLQERTCDLNTESKRFDTYMKLLDAAALQYDVERLREPNVQAFADYARSTARVRECTRDDMVMGQLWHFIPSLPEFTICEECFDQVVWPVVDQPVASSVKRTLQLVPGTQRNTGISCQLYSERMRRKFLEAVKHADFDYLKQTSLKRYGIERLLQEKHKMLMNDMAAGKDRTAELQANIEEWRKRE